MSLQRLGGIVDLTPPLSSSSTGFFALFTVMMAISQLQLLASSLTTIESFSIRSQRDRERATLSRLGFCAFRDKMQTKRRWEKEWGDFGTEGNRWWVGPASREIKQTMGDDPLGWICELQNISSHCVLTRGPLQSQSADRRVMG